MVRANSPRYGPMGALRVERVTKPDGRYVLYYSWPDAPDSRGEDASAGREPSASPGKQGPSERGRSDNAPVQRASSTSSARSDGGV
jgi:hypothetical protein